MKNKKGFTLVEMLAVIVILGLLMAIAVQSVTKYIEKSRRDTYIATAREYITVAAAEIAKGTFVIRNPETIYSIHYSNLKLERNQNKSPYGAWVDAYVIVTIDDANNYTYYWTSIDTTGHRVDLTEESELDASDIYVSTDFDLNPNYPVGGRDNAVLYGEDGKRKEEDAVVEVTEEKANECYEWTDGEEGITITNYSSSCPKDVSIPSKIGDRPVVAIGVGAFRKKGITNVSLYSGVNSIGYAAFQGNNMNTVKLSRSIKTVDDYAFYNSNIQNLIMSEGITSIGSWSFANNKICKVTFPNTLKTIGSYAFYNNCLSDVSLPSGSGIGGAAFANNKITEDKAFIYLRRSDGTIDYSTIIGYAGTKKNNLVIASEKNGVKLKTIGSNAFASLGLTGSVYIPDTVTSIGGDAFAFNNISSVHLPASLKTISSGAFRSNDITSLEIPNGVTSIGTGAFRTNRITGENQIIYARKSDGTIDYSTIVSYGGGRVAGTITVPAEKNGVKLKLIKSGAFSECKLTAITLPSLSQVPTLTVEANAFKGNNVSGANGFIYKITNGKIDYSNLSDYAGPTGGIGGVITIPEQANGVDLKTISASFSWFSYKKIVIPSKVTSIAASAFSKDARNNVNLVTIVNKTGRAFNWKSITASKYDNNFVTGTIKHHAGDIEVVAN